MTACLSMLCLYERLRMCMTKTWVFWGLGVFREPRTGLYFFLGVGGWIVRNSRFGRLASSFGFSSGCILAPLSTVSGRPFAGPRDTSPACIFTPFCSLGIIWDYLGLELRKCPEDDIMSDEYSLRRSQHTDRKGKKAWERRCGCCGQAKARAGTRDALYKGKRRFGTTALNEVLRGQVVLLEILYLYDAI